MYNERRESFAIQDVILQISFVVLFVFLLLWLFPTKDFVKKEIANVITGETFTEKVDIMKNAAQGYFTDERLPAKVGDKVKITLGEMVSRKLVLAFDESYKCDTEKSYVEITKMDNEYVMKVNLSCGTKTDYVLAYMGCYTYCESTLCEKEEEKPITPVVSAYEYQYKKATAGYLTDWSAFGAWTLVKETTNENKKEETKTEQVFDKYESYQVQTGTTSTQVVDYYKSTQVIDYYKSTQVIDHYDTKTVQTDTTTVGTGTYVRGSKIGTFEYPTAMAPSTTREYVLVAIRPSASCTSPCVRTNIYVYDVYYRIENTTTTAVYGTEKVAVYKTVKEPVYKTVSEPVYKTVTTAVYETKQRAVYKDVTSYRYQTRSFVAGTVTYKWSKSKTDKTLLDSGYTLTGLKRAYNA